MSITNNLLDYFLDNIIDNIIITNSETIRVNELLNKYTNIYKYDNECNNDKYKNNKYKHVNKKYFKNYIAQYNLLESIPLLKISKNYTKYLKIFNDNVFTNIHEQNEDILNKYNLNFKSNANTIIKIDKNKFINLSFGTYKNNFDIIKQFLLDLPRVNVYINGQKINTINDIINIISPFNRDISFDNDILINHDLLNNDLTNNDLTNNNLTNNNDLANNNLLINNKSKKIIEINILIIILVLICQSSFYMSFNHLHEKIKLMHENNENNDIFVTDSKEKNLIFIKISDNDAQFTFYGKYRIIDITTNTALYFVDSEIIIDMYKDSGLIVYKVCE